MQTPKEIDDSYRDPDPWKFQINKDDILRKNLIVSVCNHFAAGAYRCLDIGAGEGWITKDLPGYEKFGFEISERARKRMPGNVISLDWVPSVAEFDLIVASGCMYPHYGAKKFLDIIVCNHSRKGAVVVTCNIKGWEMPNIVHYISSRCSLKGIFTMEFTYRQHRQMLRVFS